MELIPILSLIILVATISTFILAVGAYVLYKVRESKGSRAIAPVPHQTEAEIFTPQAGTLVQEIQQQAAYQGTQFQPPAVAYQPSAVYKAPIQEVQSRPAYSQIQPERMSAQPEPQRYTRPAPQQQQVPTTARVQEYQAGPSPQHEEATNAEQQKDKKFMKYTSEGYVPVSKATKTGENLKWR
ncbi:MAG: hypothetical protein WCJ01_06190 [Ignavibacteria bacterium]